MPLVSTVDWSSQGFVTDGIYDETDLHTYKLNVFEIKIPEQHNILGSAISLSHCSSLLEVLASIIYYNGHFPSCPPFSHRYIKREVKKLDRLTSLLLLNERCSQWGKAILGGIKTVFLFVYELFQLSLDFLFL